MANRKKETPYQISIVIGTLNRPLILKKLLSQLSSINDLQFEVLVFDQSNNSNYRKLKSSFPKHSNFHLYHLQIPNTCKYLNLGWQKAKAPIILYLDDDVEITENTISNHIKTYDNPKILGVAGRVINKVEKVLKVGKVGKVEAYGAIFNKSFSSLQKQYVDFPYGCNMSFRKSILKEIGGFDEKLSPPIYSFNEVDLGYRIIKKYPNSIIFEPLALVYHQQYKTGGTRTYSNKEIYNSTSFNYGYFIGKNFSLWQNILFLLRRLPFQVIKEPKEIPNIVKGFIKGKLQKNHWHFILFWGIIAFAIFSRFWKLSEFFTFNFDEEYQALLAWEQVKHLHKIWIGVSASTVNYYLGPGITYLNAILFKINKDPVILGYFGSTLGILTIITIYFVTKKIWSQKAALFASSFYTGSLFINYFDRRFWNDSPIPIISVLMLYGLVKMRDNSRWLIFCVLLMGVALHVHLSLLVFWPVIIIIIISNFKKIPFIIYLKSLILFLFVTFPLFIFDLVHNFDNMLMPVRYVKIFFSTKHEGNIMLGWSQLLNTLSRLLYLKPYTNVQDEIQLGVHGLITPTILPLSFLSLFIIGWIFYKTIKNPQYRIIALSMVSFIAVYLFYPGGVVAYFLLGFIALFAISVGIFFSRLPNLISIPLIIIFMTVNLYSLLTTQQEQFGLLTRKKLIQKIMPAVGNKSFYLETRSIDKRQYHSMGGWRYLFKAYGKTPSQSHADDFFGWIYSPEISKDKPELRVIVSEYPTIVNNPIIGQFREGIYYGYIINNE